ncbi:prmA [Symbiodinium sp. CCMP2456]|nr:prmA [Symbiodinium sp. CCMP2456]
MDTRCWSAWPSHLPLPRRNHPCIGFLNSTRPQSLPAAFLVPASAVATRRAAWSSRLRKGGRAAGSETAGASETDVMEVTLETDQPDAVMELLLGFGANSASAMAANTRQATLRVVSAQFEGSSDILAKLDLEQIGCIIQGALDLPRKPLLKSRLLGGSWSKYFPLSESVEVRLPCHAGPRGGMLSETGRRVLRLEGGVAFGAGDHPTTRGAAAFLEATLTKARPLSLRCLDYGTGSGVLAICAWMLGAKHTLGVDVDKTALASAARSLALNGTVVAPFDVLGTVAFKHVPACPELATKQIVEMVEEGGAFDIVVANILCEPLLQLVDTLSCATAPAGKLCLSGVRSLPDLRAVEALQDKYSEQFENFQISDAGAGWCVITAEKGFCAAQGVLYEARFLFRDHDS